MNVIAMSSCNMVSLSVCLVIRLLFSMNSTALVITTTSIILGCVCKLLHNIEVIPCNNICVPNIFSFDRILVV